MKLLVQCWVAPSPPVWPFQAGKEYNGFRFRVVEHVGHRGDTGQLLLIEFDASIGNIEDDWDIDRQRLASLIRRLNFMMAGQLRVISAHLIEYVDGPSKRNVHFRVINREALTNEIIHVRSGGKVEGHIVVSKLVEDVCPEVDTALAWLQAGLKAGDSITSAIFYWCGIEAIVPNVSSPWGCTKCNAQYESCPQCGAATSSPRVRQSLIKYFVDAGLATKKEVDSLYSVRCELVHGKRAYTSEDYQFIATHSNAVGNLLVRSICREMRFQGDGGPRFVEWPGVVVPTIQMTMQAEWHETIYTVPMFLYE